MIEAIPELIASRLERGIHRPRTLRRLAHLLHGRTASLRRRDVEATQRRRLDRLIRHVHRQSEFYRQRLESCRIDPEKTVDPEALRELPLTSGTELREQGDAIRCIDPETIAASFLSSGSTGAPKRVDYSSEDVQRIANGGALLLRVDEGDGPLRAAIAMPLRHGLWVGWRQTVWIIERAGGLALTVGEEHPEQIAEVMRRYDVNVLASSPSFALRLADAFADSQPPPLRRILLGAELLRREDLDEIRHRFPTANVHSSYAATELGVGLASSWRNELPILFNELEVLVEIIDPESGRAADEGELIYTTLNRRGMPLIRYRSGDRGRWAEHAAPYPFRAIEMLGRIDETLVIAGSNLTARAIAELAESSSDRQRIEVSLTREAGHYHLRVRVEGELREDQFRRRLIEDYPRLKDHLDNDELQIAVEPNADLSKQLKRLVIRDRT